VPVRAAWTSALCAAALLVPRLALACSACMASLDERSQEAFVATTVFLSVLPLSMFAGFGVWIWRRHRKLELATRLEGSPAAPEGAAADAERRRA
jgi:hypothetical protein